MTIQELVKTAHEIAKSKGFWDSERNTGELLMLIVSELAEAMEADRKDVRCSLNSTELELGQHIATMDTEAFKVFYENNIKGSFEEEIADAYIRLFDLTGGMNIDILNHVLLKMEYNKTRSKLHGKKY